MEAQQRTKRIDAMVLSTKASRKKIIKEFNKIYERGELSLAEHDLWIAHFNIRTPIEQQWDKAHSA